MDSKTKTRIILFLLVVIIALLGLPQAFAVDFKKDVQLEVIPGSVYYVFKTNVSIPSITIDDEKLILDGTDVLDFQPGAGRLTITIYDWERSSNSFGIKNTVDETTFFSIKRSGTTYYLVEGGVYHENSVTTTTSETFWEYKPAVPNNPVGGGGGSSPTVTTTNNATILSGSVFTEGFLARKLFEFRLPLKTTSGELEKTFSIRSWMLLLATVIILTLIIVNIIRNRMNATRRYGE